jgi:hypothetical protein
MHPPTVSPADDRPDLGPRSLDPDRPFGGAYAERIRGQTSPTDFCNCTTTTCGQPNRSSRFSQGRRPRPPSFSFRVSALSLAGAVTRGEPRYVRPIRPRCRFLPLAWVCPTAIPKRARHLRRLSPPQHSDDRRARVEGPSEGRVSRDARAMISRLAPGACALIFNDRACETAFPSSAPSGHPRVIGAPDERGGTPLAVADRPRPPFRRRPAKDDAIPKTRMPSTVSSA